MRRIRGLTVAVVLGGLVAPAQADATLVRTLSTVPVVGEVVKAPLRSLPVRLQTIPTEVRALVPGCSEIVDTGEETEGYETSCAIQLGPHEVRCDDTMHFGVNEVACGLSSAGVPVVRCSDRQESGGHWTQSTWGCTLGDGVYPDGCRFFTDSDSESQSCRVGDTEARCVYISSFMEFVNYCSFRTRLPDGQECLVLVPRDGNVPVLAAVTARCTAPAPNP